MLEIAPSAFDEARAQARDPSRCARRVQRDAAWANRIEAPVEGVLVPGLGRQDLVINKRATGRDKDRADVKGLEGRAWLACQQTRSASPGRAALVSKSHRTRRRQWVIAATSVLAIAPAVAHSSRIVGMKRRVGLHGDVVARPAPQLSRAHCLATGPYRGRPTAIEIIGLDLHRRESQLSIKAEDRTITDRRIATSRERLTAVFGAQPPARILLEASTESEWVARHLVGAVRSFVPRNCAGTTASHPRARTEG